MLFKNLLSTRRHITNAIAEPFLNLIGGELDTHPQK
jgi:hypothetical protein